MNEARVVQRYCVCCGEWFSVYLDARKHWWQPRHINTTLSEGKYFGEVRISGFRNSGAKLDLIDDEVIITYDDPLWKRTLDGIRSFIEDLLDPPEMAEYWECNTCYVQEEDDLITRR